MESPVCFGHYTRRFVDYPGQEALSTAKRRNQRLLAAFLDGTVIRPGETFSVWHLAGRPTERLGYAHAAALKEGRLVTDVGGAICLLSTLIFNTALLGGLVIVERWCHSVDSYGDRRYFDLGRDAAIEYGYRDLRFRNHYSFPVRLRIAIDEPELRSWLESAEHPGITVCLDVEVICETDSELAVTTTRTITSPQGADQVDRFESRHSKETLIAP